MIYAVHSMVDPVAPETTYGEGAGEAEAELATADQSEDATGASTDAASDREEAPTEEAAQEIADSTQSEPLTAAGSEPRDEMADRRLGPETATMVESIRPIEVSVSGVAARGESIT